MPIFQYNGRYVNVPDKRLDEFIEKHPDALSIDNVRADQYKQNLEQKAKVKAESDQYIKESMPDYVAPTSPLPKQTNPLAEQKMEEAEALTSQTPEEVFQSLQPEQPKTSFLSQVPVAPVKQEKKPVDYMPEDVLAQMRGLSQAENMETSPVVADDTEADRAEVLAQMEQEYEALKGKPLDVEASKALRASYIAKSFYDPVAAIPEAFKERIAKRNNSDDRDAIFGAWVNTTPEKKEAFLKADEYSKYLTEKQKEIDERIEEVSKNLKKPSSFRLMPHGLNTVGAAQVYGDAEMSALLAAKADIQDAQSRIDRAKERLAKGDIGNFEEFMSGMADVMSDTRTWDHGQQELLHQGRKAQTLSNEMPSGSKRLQELFAESNRAIADAEQKMVSADRDKAQVEQNNQDPWFYRMGEMAGHMPAFMLDFIATSGGGQSILNFFGKKGAAYLAKEIGEEGVEFIAKNGLKQYFKQFGAKSALKWAWGGTVKFLGGAADDMLIHAPIMTFTIQGPATAADAIDRKLGQVVEDEQGNLSYENKKSWLDAGWQAVANSVVENASEMVGNRLIGFSTKGMAQAAETFGLKTVSRVLNTLDNSAFMNFMRTSSAWLEKAGINGVFDEIGEEYYGQLLRTGLGLDDAFIETPEGRKNLLKSWDFHKDIWGGMFLSMGAMKAVQTAGAGVATGLGAAANYISVKMPLDRADRRAEQTLGTEVWQNMRAMIDNTSNEDMTELVSAITQQNMSAEEREDVLSYIAASLSYRGFNLANRALARNVEDARSVNHRLAAYDMVYGGNIEADMAKYNLSYEFIRAIQHNATPEQLNAALRYIELKQAAANIYLRQEDELEGRIQAANMQVDGHTNQQTGTLIRGYLATREGDIITDPGGNPIPYSVIDGNVAVGNDGRLRVTSNTCVVRTGDGRLSIVPGASLAGVSEFDPAQEKARFEEQIRAEEQARRDAELNQDAPATEEQTTPTEAAPTPEVAPATEEQAPAALTSEALAAQFPQTQVGQEALADIQEWIANETPANVVYGWIDQMYGDIAPLAKQYYDALIAEASAPVVEPLSEEQGPAPVSEQQQPAPTNEQQQPVGVEALIIRDKNGDLDIKAMRDAGVTPEQMVEIFAMEYGEEALDVASEYLDIANDALAKEKDPAKRRGSRRADTQYWGAVVEGLTPVAVEETQPVVEEETPATEEETPTTEETQPVVEEETPVEKALRQIADVKAWMERASNATADEERESFESLAYSAIGKLKGMLELLSGDELEEIRLQGSYDGGPIDDAIYREFKRRGKAEGFKFPESESTPTTEQEPITETTEPVQTSGEPNQTSSEPVQTGESTEETVPAGEVKLPTEQELFYDKVLAGQGEIERKPSKAKGSIFDATVKDKLRPIMGGIYHDGGYGVATTGRLLIADKSAYEVGNDGIVTNRKGEKIEGNFPKWRMVASLKPEQLRTNMELNLTDLLGFLGGVKAKLTEEGRKSDIPSATVLIRMSNGEVAAYLVEELERFAKAAIRLGATHIGQNGLFGEDILVLSALSDRGATVLMPVKVPTETYNVYAYDQEVNVAPNASFQETKEQEPVEETKPKQKSITEQLFEVREEEFQAMLDRGNLEELNEYRDKVAELLRETPQEKEAIYAKLRMLNEILEKFGEVKNAPQDVREEYERMQKDFDYLYSRQEVRNRLTRLDAKIREIKQAREAAEKQRRAGLFNGYLRFDNSLEQEKKEEALNKRMKVDGKLVHIAEFIENLVTDANTKLVRTSKGEYFVNGKKVNKVAYDYAVYLTEHYRQAPLLQRAKYWQENVGVKVRVVEDIRELPYARQRSIIALQNAGGRNYGWYNRLTGEVGIYLPHIDNIVQIDETYVHEVVGHNGMRILMGDQWDALCDAVWNSMSAENKRHYRDYAIRTNKIPAKDKVAVQRNAANEYMAHLAEKIDFTAEEKTIWDNIVEFVKDALAKLGVKFDVTEDMCRALLRASYRNLQEINNVKDAFEQAQEIVDAQNNEQDETIQSAKEAENNSENSVEGEEKIVPLSQIKDFSYGTTRRLITGVERGSIGVRCLGEEMERGRRGLPLCIAALISAGHLESDGQVGAMVSSESRGKESKEQRQASRAEASVVGGIIKWAKDHGFYQTLSDTIQGAEVNATNKNAKEEGIYTHTGGYSIRVATEASAEDVLKYIEAITLYNQANQDTKIEVTGFGVAPNGDLLIFSRQNQTGVSPLNTSGLEVSAKDVEIIASEEALDRLMEEELPPTEEELIISEAKANGTYMLAPNGKKSRLSPEQWVMVRTKAFKKWFGDWEKITKNADGSWNIPEGVSHIIDANGEPLVVYHGSPNKWDVFDLEKFGSVTDDGYYGRGLYLSEDKDMAAAYGEPEAFFVNIKTPLRIGQAEELIEDMDEANRRADLALLFNRENAPEELKKYDGVLYLALGPVFEEIVVPRANQIKSATDNVGTYGTETDNIHFRKGDGPLTNEELSLINDPAAKLYGQSFRSKAQQKKFAENTRQRMAQKAQTLAEKLGLPVEVLENNEGLTGKQAQAKGWYEVKSGKITIVLSNNESVADIEETILHEGVAHLGLRKLFGKQFTQFLDNVYNNAEQSIRDQIDRYAKNNNVSTRTATEEYLAHLAESTDFERAQQSGWWQKIKQFFIDMLDTIGFEYKGNEIGDAELRYLLWRSYENLTDPTRRINPFSQAREVALQNQMKKEAKERKERERILATGTVDSNQFASVAESSDAFEQAGDIMQRQLDKQVEELEEELTLYRMSEPGESLRAAYDRIVSSDWYLMQEIGVDYLKSLQTLQNLLAERSRGEGAKVRSSQDAYNRLLALSSRSKEDVDTFNGTILPDMAKALHNILGTNPTKQFVRWLLQAPFRVVRGVFTRKQRQTRGGWLDWERGENERKLISYIFAMHGIERNRDMAVRAAMQELAEKEYTTALEDATRAVDDIIAGLEVEIAEAEAKIEELKEAINNTSDSKEKKRLKDELKDKKDSLAVKKSGLAEAEKKRRELPRFPKKYGLKTKEDYITARYDEWYGKMEAIRVKTNLSWREQQEEMDALAIKEFGDEILAKEYSGLKESMDLEGYDTSETLDDEGNVVTTAAAQTRISAYDYVEEYERKIGKKKLGNLWKGIHKITNWMLDRQMKSGLVDEAYVKDSRRHYQYYAPLRGFAEAKAEDVYDYLDEGYHPSNNPVQRAKGRESRAANPFSNLLDMAFRTIQTGNRNEAKQAFWRLATQAGDANQILSASKAWYVGNLSKEDLEELNANVSYIIGKPLTQGEWVTPNILDSDSSDEVLRKTQEFEAVMKKMAELGLVSQRKTAKAKLPYSHISSKTISNHTVQVFIDGKLHTITVLGDPRAAMALNGKLTPEQNRTLPASLTSYNRFVANAYTSLSLPFAVSNLGRDILASNRQMYITHGASHMRKFAAKQMCNVVMMPWLVMLYENTKGAPARTKMRSKLGELNLSKQKQKRFFDFMQQGGATGFTFSLSQRETLEHLQKLINNPEGIETNRWWNFFGYWFDFVDLVASSSELVSRFAAYEAALDAGMTAVEAIAEAKEVTANFNRKGSGLRGIEGKEASLPVSATAWASQLGREGIVFWNAGMQGVHQMLHNIKHHTGKSIPSYLVGPMVGNWIMRGVMSPLLIATYMMFGAWDDDDDKEDESEDSFIDRFLAAWDDETRRYYEEVPDYERHRKILIPSPKKGDYITLPVDILSSRVWHTADALFGEWAGHREFDLMDDAIVPGINLVTPPELDFGSEGDDIITRGTRLVTSAVAPTLGQNASQLRENRDWKGAPIRMDEPWNEHYPEYQRVYGKTGAAYVAASEFLSRISSDAPDSYKRGSVEINPANIQFVTEMLFGGMEDLMVIPNYFFSETKEELDRYSSFWDLPVANRLYLNSSESYKTRTIRGQYSKSVDDFMKGIESRKGRLRKDIINETDSLEQAALVVNYTEFLSSDEYLKYKYVKAYDKEIQATRDALRNAHVYPEELLEDMKANIRRVKDPDYVKKLRDEAEQSND